MELDESTQNYIRNKVNKALLPYPNFAGLQFCDVHAGGIQINCFHKDIKRYAYGGIITLKYNLSNLEECIQNIIEMWKYYDTPERLEEFKKFVAFGEQWGWD